MARMRPRIGAADEQPINIQPSLASFITNELVGVRQIAWGRAVDDNCRDSKCPICAGELVWVFTRNAISVGVGIAVENDITPDKIR